ncbi:uncharacterized protein PV09_09032 [Verruconis gallopava]|uniref:Carboxypeptidase n=1 Tax=Verruconis gallopava TaxID=253628 RepID=A0A0D1ZXS6_9PEZI|nr:uncharacterized protein PV09_09032 [Verruconis gallopava]KIV99262.1 hypothetical protein PV09_09032 [Verruconis gallopava]
MGRLTLLSSRWRRKSSSFHSVLALAALLLFLPGGCAKSAADYFVHSLPGAPDDEPLIKMHAGHVEVTPEHHGNLFFWHFENMHLADRPRTVIWLNGGPGCSSEDGALMEVGPYRVRKGGKLERIDGAWNEFANLLFVDNPVGTGFSYVDTDSYLHELQEMADQFVVFLEKWFEMFPHFQHDDIYIAGESYAGQHIPYVAKAILERNKKKKSGADMWNLKGLLIGNGWISGPDQYPSYLQYAYEHGLIKPGTKQSVAVEHQQAICLQDLSNGGKDKVDTPSCESILQIILQETETVESGTRKCVNMYDIRLKDTAPSCGMSWPPDLAEVTPYLRRSDVIQALHVNPDKKTGWVECNGAVGGAFTVSKSVPSIKFLPDLLAELPIILFSGDQDLICNHMGTEELINKLEFNGGKGFESNGVTAPRLDWVFEGEPAGIYQSARNLTYIKFYNSSHMVPFDYPRRTRDMLDRFMNVDIGTVGGKPVDSIIGGEKSPQTSVGGHPNSTIAEEDQAQRLKEATYKAYYKSGEVAFVVVLVAAIAWGFFVWRGRRRRAGYQGVFGGDPEDNDARGRLNGRASTFKSPAGRFTDRPAASRDLEAADFDEAELDDLVPEGSSKLNGKHDLEDRYSLGGDSDDDADIGKAGGNVNHN